MSKDEEFLDRMANFFQSFLKILPPVDEGNKSTTPFNIFQNVMGVINKVVDGVTIGIENLPPYMATILEINRDAQKAFIDGRYSDYIELKYKGAEIFYKSLYQEVFRKPIDEKSKYNLSDYILAIEQKLNANSGILKELNEWRGIRNEIVHHHLKVDRKKAEEAKRFFDKLYDLFKLYLKK